MDLVYEDYDLFYRTLDHYHSKERLNGLFIMDLRCLSK